MVKFVSQSEIILAFKVKGPRVQAMIIFLFTSFDYFRSFETVWLAFKIFLAGFVQLICWSDTVVFTFSSNSFGLYFRTRPATFFSSSRIFLQPYDCVGDVIFHS